jgi:energy-coupling factor transport system ATP-binding protein
MAYIEISNLSWRYRENSPDVLKNVNLSINKGDFFGIMGATGSGKSSFALAVRGLIPAFFEEGKLQGKVVIGDIEVTKSDANLLADKIGMVFQDASSQILGTTVHQDVAFGPSNLCYPKERVLELVDRYLQKVRLTDKSDRSPAMLSGGEMQRLAAAGVLCMEPSILVLDEPAAELDPRGKDELCVMLDDLRKEQDITIILIEQDPELIVRYSDRVAIFNHGEVALLGSPREVFSNTEKCIEMGVFPPEIVQLAHSLTSDYKQNFSPLPLTSGEMHEQVLAKIAARGQGAKQIYVADKEKTTKLLEISETFIKIENLSHIYSSTAEKVTALKNINLSITAGEYVTIIGSNGAGKTTLTKHLNGLLQPTTGKVYYRGEDVAKKQTAELSTEIGYGFQNPDHQIFSKTVHEEIAFGLVNLGMNEEEINDRVSRVLDLVGLGDVSTINPYNLGKGERQKVALASTIVLEPKTLVIDEPTTGLDWIESKRVLNLIHELNKKGTTVIVVTHDMRIVREYATRVIAMNAGEIVFDGTPYELMSSPEVFKVTNVGMTPVFHLYYSLSEYFPASQKSNLHTLEDFSEFVAGVLNA